MTDVLANIEVSVLGEIQRVGGLTMMAARQIVAARLVPPARVWVPPLAEPRTLAMASRIL